MVDIEELVAAYRGGASMQALADQHGLSRHAVRRRLQSAGVTTRGAGRQRLPVSSEDVAELRDAGVGWEEISVRLGLRPGAARQRYDEVRSQRGLVRRGGWHQILTDALSSQEWVAVLPTVTASLGRRPTSNEARSARRAAHDLARRGEAVITHEPVTWRNQQTDMLVLRLPVDF